MNAYDFDKTVFNPDSSYAFILYCFRRFPGAFIKRLPRTAWKAIRYYCGAIEFRELKEQLFSFLGDIEDAESVAEDFWTHRFKDVEPWYLRQKRPDDVIISASPEFLLAPVCQRLNVHLIATKMDAGSGRILGENCHDREKVRRFCAEYPGAHPECFYSDSLSDTPMAEIADRAYLVDHSAVSPWPQKNT